MSSVPTSNKVIVLRKGKRKKTNNFFDKSQPEDNESDDDLSEDLSSEEEFLPHPSSSIHKPSFDTASKSHASYHSSFAAAADRNFAVNGGLPSNGPFSKASFGQNASGSDAATNKSVAATETRHSPQQPPNSAQTDTENEDANADEDDEEIDFMDYEESVRLKIEQTRNQMKYILANFTPEQMHRYETFRRIGFSRSVIKKIMQQALGHSVNPNAVFLMGGVAKVYAGELVEEAKDVMNEWGETGPLLPSHLIEAHRRLKCRAGSIFSCNKFQKRIF